MKKIIITRDKLTIAIRFVFVIVLKFLISSPHSMSDPHMGHAMRSNPHSEHTHR